MATTHTDAPGWPRSRCPTSGCPTPSRCSRRRLFAERLERLRAAMDDARLRPPRRVGRPRAQRQPRLPQRLRPALRGGGAGRRPAPAIRPSLVGNECYGMADAAPLPMRLVTLPGPEPARASRATPRRSLPADPARRGHRRRQPGRRRRVEDLRDRATRSRRRRSWSTSSGGRRRGGLVENATDLLIDPADGLRVVNEVDQLAAFEWAACQTSQGVRSVLDRPAARA